MGFGLYNGHVSMLIVEGSITFPRIYIQSHQLSNWQYNNLRQHNTVDPQYRHPRRLRESYITKKKHIQELKISGGIGGRRSTEGRYWERNNNKMYWVQSLYNALPLNLMGQSMEEMIALWISGVLSRLLRSAIHSNLQIQEPICLAKVSVCQ